MEKYCVIKRFVCSHAKNAQDYILTGEKVAFLKEKQYD